MDIKKVTAMVKINLALARMEKQRVIQLDKLKKLRADHARLKKSMTNVELTEYYKRIA